MDTCAIEPRIRTLSVLFLIVNRCNGETNRMYNRRLFVSGGFINCILGEAPRRWFVIDNRKWGRPMYILNDRLTIFDEFTQIRNLRLREKTAHE